MLDIAPAAFIVFIQNHDQVANSARGDRFHRLTSPGRHRALTALQLLGPSTPLIFQGQEYSASTPFLYFGDYKPELAEAIHRGRQKSALQFPSLATEAMQALLPYPSAPETFARSKLDPNERGRSPHAEALRCTATSCGCGATTRCFASSTPAWSTAPCSAPRRWCSAGSAPAGTTACSW